MFTTLVFALVLLANTAAAIKDAPTEEMEMEGIDLLGQLSQELRGLTKDLAAEDSASEPKADAPAYDCEFEINKSNKAAKFVGMKGLTGKACVDACLEKKEENSALNGVTVHMSQPGCYCDIGVTGTKRDKNWKACTLKPKVAPAAPKTVEERLKALERFVQRLGVMNFRWVDERKKKVGQTESLRKLNYAATLYLYKEEFPGTVSLDKCIITCLTRAYDELNYVENEKDCTCIKNGQNVVPTAGSSYYAFKEFKSSSRN